MSASSSSSGSESKSMNSEASPKAVSSTYPNGVPSHGAIITLDDVSWSIDVPSYPPGTGAGKKIVDTVLRKVPTVTKKILNNITGTFMPGQVTALIGPSGAGKSTLLDVVSQRKNSGLVTGDVLINQNAPSDTRAFKRLVGYVEQDDILPDTLTVREAIRYSAELKLDKTRAEIDEIVEKLVIDLDLTTCANSIIGSRLTRGISGGQAKRVNLALQLVVDPEVLFLDEPTTGLDSLTALNLLKLVHELASRGRTVVLTIHSPSEEIFNLIDNVVLLATGGRLAYWGPRADAIDYLQGVSGSTVPEGMNPADWLLDVLRVDPKGQEGDGDPVQEVEMTEVEVELATKKAAVSLAAGNHLTEAWVDSEGAKANKKTLESVNSVEKIHPAFDPSEKQFAHGIFKEFAILWRRTMKMFLRNPQFIGTRVGRNVFMGILIGTVFWQLGTDQIGLRDSVSVTFFVTTHALMGVMVALPLLIEQQVLVRVESAGSAYRKSTYLNVVVILESIFMIVGMFILIAFVFPCVGTLGDTFIQFVEFAGLLSVTALSSVTISTLLAVLFTDMDTALAVAPVALILMLILNGFLLTPENIPAGYKPIHYISPAKYGFEMLLKTTFTNSPVWECTTEQLSCVASSAGSICVCAITSGQTLLENYGYENVNNVEWTFVVLAEYVGFYLLTLFVQANKDPVRR